MTVAMEDDRTAECDNKQTALEELACKHESAITTVLHPFQARWEIVTENVKIAACDDKRTASDRLEDMACKNDFAITTALHPMLQILTTSTRRWKEPCDHGPAVPTAMEECLRKVRGRMCRGAGGDNLTVAEEFSLS